jgi:hypothetical protein
MNAFPAGFKLSRRAWAIRAQKLACYSFGDKMPSHGIQIRAVAVLTVYAVLSTTCSSLVHWRAAALYLS